MHNKKVKRLHNFCRQLEVDATSHLDEIQIRAFPEYLICELETLLQ